MLRFAHIYFLWGLALVPVLILLFLRTDRWKRRALASLGDEHVVKRMIPEVSFSRPRLKFVLLLFAYVFMIVGLADPQIGSKMEEVKRTGSDLIILLDVSNSMLAEDLPPNRLENARRAIEQLIENLHNDRIGIIVFAGEAYVQLPLTTDYSAAKLFLSSINTNMVPTQGTAIGAAINLGLKSFDFRSATGKSLIIMTDGENHEDDAVAAAGKAQERGVVVNVIGLGSPGGAPIPVYSNGRPAGFHKDMNGQTVVSKLNEEMGREIAGTGGGVYVRATSANSGMDVVLNQLSHLQKEAYDSKVFKDFEDRFQFFLALAFLLLVVEFFLLNRKNARLNRFKLFEVRKP